MKQAFSSCFQAAALALLAAAPAMAADSGDQPVGTSGATVRFTRAGAFKKLDESRLWIQFGADAAGVDGKNGGTPGQCTVSDDALLPPDQARTALLSKTNRFAEIARTLMATRAEGRKIARGYLIDGEDRFVVKFRSEFAALRADKPGSAMKGIIYLSQKDLTLRTLSAECFEAQRGGTSAKTLLDSIVIAAAFLSQEAATERWKPNAAGAAP